MKRQEVKNVKIERHRCPVVSSLATLVLAQLIHEGTFYKPVAISPQFLRLSPGHGQCCLMHCSCMSYQPNTSHSEKGQHWKANRLGKHSRTAGHREVGVQRVCDPLPTHIHKYKQTFPCYSRIIIPADQVNNSITIFSQERRNGIIGRIRMKSAV